MSAMSDGTKTRHAMMVTPAHERYYNTSMKHTADAGSDAADELHLRCAHGAGRSAGYGRRAAVGSSIRGETSAAWEDRGGGLTI